MTTAHSIAAIRRQMVEQQVRTWDVFDPRVLDVMQTVPRESFAPTAYDDVAYAETEIPLGHGQFMMNPVVEGRLLQALELQADDAVLEIGTGSGYLAACIAELAGRVVSIDCVAEFCERATSVLEETGIDNVDVRHMDAMDSLPDERFDAIAVTGSIPRPDERLLECLKSDGRMFVVVGEGPVMTAHMVRHAEDGGWSSEGLFETTLRPLTNVPETPPFRF